MGISPSAPASLNRPVFHRVLYEEVGARSIGFVLLLLDRSKHLLFFCIVVIDPIEIQQLLRM